MALKRGKVAPGMYDPRNQHGPLGPGDTLDIRICQLSATNLAASMRRWRLTSAAVLESVADQRSAGWACWRGSAAGLGGWTFVTRLSLTTLQATGMGFFGLYGSTAALATALTLAAAINCIGIGFQRGTHSRDAEGAGETCTRPPRRACRGPARLPVTMMA
jgi:hypothetical protein